MSFRTRILVALVLVTAVALVPSPDGSRAQLTHLRVRDWLLDARDSPLTAWVADGRMPALAVEVLLSPPIEDPGRLAAEKARYARIAAEWAQARTHGGTPTTIDPGRGTLLLTVRAGSHGIAAAIAQPSGAAASLQVPYPDRWSLLPAVLAIAIAFATRSVLGALLLGGLAGAIAHVATAVPGVTPSFLDATLHGVRHYFVSAVWQRSLGEDFYLRVTLFVALLFVTIGIVARNGGIHGLVALLQRRVRGPRSVQFCTFLTGIAIFFDDYSNCLLTGTAMRPLADSRRVSREKLAYLVDSTAAPIAGLSIFSTWVVYEMSQYRLPLTQVTRRDGTLYTANDTFEVFLASMPFRFYCLFALGLVLLVILLRRDFGPMLAAERRARRTGQVLAPDARGIVDVDAVVMRPTAGTPRRARNAVVPLAALILGTVGCMLWQGLSAAPLPGGEATFGDRLRHVLANAHSDEALLWASVGALAIALCMTFAQRLLSGRETARTALRSTKALYVPIGILFFAWSLGHVCHDLGTSLFLTALVEDSLSPLLLPLALFTVAGGIAFATGTSFGTMAILLPNIVVLAHDLGTATAFTGDAAAGGPALMLLCIAAVLEGSIFGDHCSPISDTTVLSSLGTQCDHLAHVTTQLPYALLASATSLVCGYLPMVALGPGWWPLSLLLGLAVMAAFLLLFGRDPDAAPDAVTSARPGSG